MATSGDVLEMPQLGVRVEIVSGHADAGEDAAQFDVVGRARGLLAAPHVHISQVERHTVLEGAMRLRMNGREHELRAGDSMEVPPGTVHAQLPGGDGAGRVRVTLRPAGQAVEFLERLAELCGAGAFTARGLPRPLAAAEIVRDFGADNHAAMPPLPVQRAAATALLGGRARLQALWRPYAFVDEWDVAAPPGAVFSALAQASTYPQWWKPVYLDVEADPGEPAVGHSSRQHFKGRLPYHLRTRSTITRLERPRLIEAEVVGDLRGRGIWTLTPADGGTHVRFDWLVHADRRLLRVLTPALRPLLRWNHGWAIARAMEGLEPFAQRGALTAG